MSHGPHSSLTRIVPKGGAQISGEYIPEGVSRIPVFARLVPHVLRPLTDDRGHEPFDRPHQSRHLSRARAVQAGALVRVGL